MQNRSVKREVLVWASVNLFLLFIVQGTRGGTIEGRVSRGNTSEDLSNVVVSVEDIEGPFTPPGKPASAKEMNQKGLRFVPHVLAILVGATVEFPNSDPVSHNVFSISEAKRFNLGLYGRDVKRSIRFDLPGVVELLCNVHMEMSAYIVVLKNPFFTMANGDGSFRIAGVPVGRHRVRCWNEHLPAQEVEINVPSEGIVSMDFDINSSPNENKNGLHNPGVPRR
jgi:plastocyanin